MPRLSNRDRQAALENDRLQTAMKVIDTFDSMAARREQLDMQRGEQDARARLQEVQIAAARKQVEEANSNLWRQARTDSDTAYALKGLETIDPMDEDAPDKLGAIRSGFIYMGDSAQKLLQEKEKAVESNRAFVDKMQADYGVSPVYQTDPLTGRRRLDMVATGAEARAAQSRLKEEASTFSPTSQALLAEFSSTREASPIALHELVKKHNQAESLYHTLVSDGVLGSSVLDKVSQTSTKSGVRFFDYDALVGTEVADPSNPAVKITVGQYIQKRNQAEAVKGSAEAQAKALDVQISQLQDLLKGKDTTAAGAEDLARQQNRLTELISRRANLALGVASQTNISGVSDTIKASNAARQSVEGSLNDTAMEEVSLNEIPEPVRKSWGDQAAVGKVVTLPNGRMFRIK